MNNKYDIIIIGAGHNGLAAAATLAKSGKKVIVLEKRTIPGGIAAKEEFAEDYYTSGLLHDTGGVRQNLIRSLELEKHGLQIVNERAPVGLLSKNGRALTLRHDVASTVEEIRTISEKDAEAYEEYRTFIDKISPFVYALVSEAPLQINDPGLAGTWTLALKGLGLKKLGNKTMLELLKVAPMSVEDFLNERFETEFLKAGISCPAIYGSFTSPRALFTTFNLLLWECTSRMHVNGGPAALINSLLSCAVQNGVDIRYNCEVNRIEIDSNGSVSGVVISDGESFNAPVVASTSTPQSTFFGMIEPYHLEYPMEHGIQHYRSRGTTAKVNLALNTKVNFNGLDPDLAYARTGNSFREMEKAFDPIKYQEYSPELLLDIYFPTVHDRSLAPDGHSVMSVLVHYIPYDFKPGWNETEKYKLGEAVINTLEQYAPGIRQFIVGKQILTPYDLESLYGLTGGHIYHGEHAVDQLTTRPIPECSGYSTPFKGLYLCGSGAHPGGGITCAPGVLGARKILKR